jgi:hypothetical protein
MNTIDDPRTDARVAAANSVLTDAFADFGVPVADVAGALHNGEQPASAQLVCKWTWFCAFGDVHPNTTGDEVIADELVMQRRSSRASIVRAAFVAAAILTLGGAANDADTAQVQRSTGCVNRLAVSHVPGRLDKVWVIRCIPTRTSINRY